MSFYTEALYQRMLLLLFLAVVFKVILENGSVLITCLALSVVLCFAVFGNEMT